ncbi:hypothetical protein V1478_014655 [Vespula squamosa]|uniref:Uncharacterized protein n=1 Tax=Vespula squamosa TaxID=30214 RepID=A0ABD2A380_VESSQ
MLPSVVKTTSTVRRSGETGHWGNRVASVVDVERFDSFQSRPPVPSRTFGSRRKVSRRVRNENLETLAAPSSARGTDNYKGIVRISMYAREEEEREEEEEEEESAFRVDADFSFRSSVHREPVSFTTRFDSTFGKARRATEGAEEPYGTFRARGTKRTSAPFLIAPCGDPDEEKEGRKEGRKEGSCFTGSKNDITMTLHVPLTLTIGSPSMASSGVAKAESSARELRITILSCIRVR